MESELSDEAKKRIEEIENEFLKQLQSGSKPDSGILIGTYPDLAPHLGNRIKLVEAVFRATRSSASSPQKAEGVDEKDRSATSSFDENSEGKVPAPPTGSKTTPEGYLQGAATLRISCPHCGNVIQLVRDQLHEVTCGSCGSVVPVDNETTQVFRPASIPKRIGRFTVIRLLGEGSFGMVYLALDDKLDIEVAVKVPRQGFFSTKKEEQRFYREAQNAAKLRHPNIVRVYEISSSSLTPFIVSEFIDGVTLSDLVSGGTLTFKDTAELMIQICEAVQHAHAKGIVHRDLKPSNILVDHERRIYVSDFGLARREDAEITMTVDGTILGTPAYMSPEQASGVQEKVDARSDVYSLGVVLYKMLCQELPFSGTKRMLLHQVIHDEPKNPRRINDSIPLDLETITLKAMAKNPSERYPSAQGLGEELKRWLRREPIIARPISKLSRFWRLCKRHPDVSSLSAAIGLLLILGTIASFVVAKSQSELRRISDNSAKQAMEAKLYADQRLYENVRQSGLSYQSQNDLMQSGYWFSRARELFDNDANRIRVGMTLDRLPKLTSLWNVGGEANVVTFSTNGDKLAVGTTDGRVLVFDVASRKLVFEQKTDGIAVFNLVFLLNGNHVAFRSGKAAVQIWDVHNNRLIKEILHSAVVASIATDSLGNILATASDDSSVKFLDAKNGSLKSEAAFKDRYVREVRFIRDSDLVLIETMALTFDEGEIHLWDLKSEALVSVLKNEDPVIMDISKDGEKFLTRSHFRNFKVWESRTGKQIGKAIENPADVVTAFFNSVADAVVTLDQNSVLSNWDYATGQRQQRDLHFGFNPYATANDIDRLILAMSSREGTTRFIWRETGTDICTLMRNSATNPNIAFHPNGRQVAIESQNGVIQVWDLAGSIPDSVLLQHNGVVRKALWTVDGNRCFTICQDGNAQLWNAKSGEKIGPAMKHDDAINECDMDSKGQIFATVSIDKTAKVWDASTATQIGKSLNHKSPVLVVSISPDSKKLVTGCLDGSVYCWPLTANSHDDPQPLFITSHAEKVTAAIFNNSGDTIASASMDGTVRCWDSTTGVPKFGPFAHPDAVYNCVFSESGERIVSVGSDGKASIWELATGKILQSLDCGGEAFHVSIGHDGRIRTCSTNGVSRIWKKVGVDKYELEWELDHPSIQSGRFIGVSSDSNIAATAGGSKATQIGSQKGAAILWDLSDGSMLAPELFHEGRVGQVYFSSDGSQLLTSSADSTARIFNITKTKLPPEETTRIFSLLGQIDSSRGHGIRLMSPTAQLKEFESLSKTYPDIFLCDATEIARWESQIERWIATNKANNQLDKSDRN